MSELDVLQYVWLKVVIGRPSNHGMSRNENDERYSVKIETGLTINRRKRVAVDVVDVIVGQAVLSRLLAENKGAVGRRQ